MKIIGGKVYDPANGVNGKIMDVEIPGGLALNTTGVAGDTLDAKGCVVMPGGIEIHSHPLGVSRLAELTGARELEAYADFDTIASEFLSTGYTFFQEAGLVVEEFQTAEKKCEKANIACSILLLNGNDGENHSIPRKFVGEKGVEDFLRFPKSEAVHHIHLPHLAKTDSIKLLKQFLKRLDGGRCHISHASHYGFELRTGLLMPAGGRAGRLFGMYPNISFDCGPIVFGPALAFTADAELSGRIAKTGGAGQFSHAKSGYAAVPYTFKKENRIDSLLWINAMEFLLYVEDLGAASLSVDFPSGGRIAGLPFIIACLMNRDLRNGFLKTLEKSAVEWSELASIKREFSIYEIATITRLAPAKAMGLKNHGHLGTGAHSAVIYEESGHMERMFSNPRNVIRRKWKSTEPR